MSGAQDIGADPTWDSLLGGRVEILQAAHGYRVSVDAVLLAASIPADKGARVLDVGCGDGGATLCLAWRAPSTEVAGIDLRNDALARLRESIGMNGFGGRVSVEPGDVAAGPPAALVAAFDWVISNPPYLPEGRTDLRDTPRDVAMVETVPLERWIEFMAGCTRDGGHLAIVHRADRIDELLVALVPHAGDVRVFPVWPHAGEAARRVIVHARKGARGPAKLCAGLVLHEADGSFTAKARAILEGGAALDVS